MEIKELTINNELHAKYTIEGTTIFLDIKKHLTNSKDKKALNESTQVLASIINMINNANAKGFNFIDFDKAEAEAKAKAEQAAEKEDVATTEDAETETIAEETTETTEDKPTEKSPAPTTELTPKFQRGNKVNYKGDADGETEAHKTPANGTYIWAIDRHPAIIWYIIQHNKGLSKSKIIEQADDKVKSILSTKLDDDKKYLIVPEYSLELAQ